MKHLLILISICSSISYAKVTLLANGKAALYNSAQSYEVVLDGDVAQKLYQGLDSTPQSVGEWTNKVSNSIFCGQHLITRKYFCSLLFLFKC